jgi:hypothetical protein
VLTKHASDETLKCHLTMHGVSKVGEGVAKIMDGGAIVVCEGGVRLDEKLKLSRVTTGTEVRGTGFDRIMPELYNLENCVETGKPVKIDLDLDLYQMEDV